MLSPGHIVGDKYRIVRLIGDGGMGSVYAAMHQVLGSQVALKFLHPEIAEQPSLKQRFLQEAQVSATIQNEHIVRVTDVDTDADGSAYLVMELLNGEPLAGLLQREGRLDPERAVHFALQICTGLQAAHERGIVHRDLKPDNVFLTPGANGPLLKLLDFGIAKLRDTKEYQMTLTRPGSVMGTPEYMAPEQAFAAETVDQRSDIYAVGIIMFEMLSGRVPVEGENPQEIAEKIIHGYVLRLAVACPGLPQGLIAVVERAMAPDPPHRFNSVMELRQALLPYAPVTDRLSAQSLLPNADRSSYLTGMATPFVPVSVTPIADPHATTGAARPGAPKTLVPMDDGPPPASQMVGTVKTQSMPAVAEQRPATAHRYAQIPATESPRKRRSSSSGPLLAIIGSLVVVGLLLGGWYYYEEFIVSYPPPPPLPVLRTASPPNTVNTPLPPDPGEPGFEPEPRSPEAPRRSNPTPRPPVDLPELPQLPPIQLPTELPTLPTQLPPGLPTFPFPGIPAPGLTGDAP